MRGSLPVGIESLADSGGHPQVRVRVVSGGQELGTSITSTGGSTSHRGRGERRREQLGPVFPNRPSWSPIRQETSRKRTILARGWRVRDKTNGRGYRIVKGLLDGTADAYGVSDLWFLRYHANELEDGVTLVSGSAAQTQAHINHFVNGEIIDGADVVVWYAGHFVHDEMAPEPHAGHIIGPELRPFNWP